MLQAVLVANDRLMSAKEDGFSNESPFVKRGRRSLLVGTERARLREMGPFS